MAAPIAAAAVDTLRYPCVAYTPRRSRTLGVPLTQTWNHTLDSATRIGKPRAGAYSLYLVESELDVDRETLCWTRIASGLRVLDTRRFS